MPKAKGPRSGLLDTWGRKNRKYADIKCAECDKAFKPNRKTTRYCSKPCAWKNNGKNQPKQAECWWVGEKGYIVGWVRINNCKHNKRYHRWLVEQFLGITLPSNVVVHHKNENKQDNRLENLEIIGFGKHSEFHNLNRIHKKGYKLDLPAEERKARSERAKQIGLGARGRAAQKH